MPNSEPDALRLQFESMRNRMIDNPGMELGDLRSMFDELAVQSSEPETVAFKDVVDDPVRGIWCTPDDMVDSITILYLHGGGYVANSAATHRKVAGHLAARAGCRTFVLDHPLAPENPYPAQLESATAAVRWLDDVHGIVPSRLVVAGDSSGANLALGLAAVLGQPALGGLVLFSPWVDLLHEGQSVDTNAESDALISRPVLEMMTSMFLGEDRSPSDPHVNALFADLTGFPPMFVTAGEDEVLLDDARRLVDRAKKHGVDADLVIGRHQQHAYPIKAGRCATADATLTSAGSWIRSVRG